jgi:hypothetical protein
MIGYQFAGFLNGHIFPHTLNFDLTPCHTSVFIFGIMVLTRKKVPAWLLALPFRYNLTEIFPVIMGLLEDICLILRGLVCGPYFYLKDC